MPYIVDNFIITAAAAAACQAFFCIFRLFLCTFLSFADFLRKSYPQWFRWLRGWLRGRGWLPTTCYALVPLVDLDCHANCLVFSCKLLPLKSWQEPPSPRH